MEIIKYEKTSKNNYNVFLSNGEVLTLDERVITDNELLLKKEVDSALYDRLNKDNRVYELIDISIKYIMVRLRSIYEMREYLKKKENEEDVIEDVITKLKALKYLDDDRFAKAFIKDKLSFTTMGDYKIKMELVRLGVDSQIIENNMEFIDSKILEEKMKKMIEKDIRTNKKYAGINLKNKIYNHLVSSGYTKEKVISVINNYNF